jgi:hypothetical protein
MSEFIKIAEVAQMLNTATSTVLPTMQTEIVSTASSEKKSGNGLLVIVGIVVIGIIGYELYISHVKSKKRKNT